MQLKHFVAHIRDHHAHSPTFSITCGMYGCPRTFRKFSSFRSHLYEHHSNDPLVTNQMIPHPTDGRPADDPPTSETQTIRHYINIGSDDAGNGGMMNTEETATGHNDPTEVSGEHGDNRDPHADLCEDREDPLRRLAKTSAIFIMGIKEKHKLSQTATQGIIEGVTNLMRVYTVQPSYCSAYMLLKHIHQVYLAALYSEVERQLLVKEVPKECLEEIQPLFTEKSPFGHPFAQVETPYHQLKFLKNNFDFIVS